MKIKLIGLTIFIGCIIGFLYNQLTVYSPENLFKEYSNATNLKQENTQSIIVNLPKDSYFLKLKYPIKDNNLKTLTINNIDMAAHLIYKKNKAEMATGYWHIPLSVIKAGNNSLAIALASSYTGEIKFSFSNFRKKLNKDIYLAFYDSINFPLKHNIYLNILFALLFIFIFFSLSIYFLSRIFTLNINKLLIYNIYSILPIAIFLNNTYIYFAWHSLYRIVIDASYILRMFLGFYFFIQVILILSIIWRNYGNPKNQILKSEAKERLFKIIKKIKSLPIFDKCLLAFVSLLLLCLVFLLLEFTEVAEFIAHIAFIFLFLGVFNSFLSIFKKDNKK